MEIRISSYSTLTLTEAFWTSILLICETATAFAACPVFGLWVDSSAGRRIPFLIGLVWLAAAMALFTAARSTTMYIVGRILQGLASAVVDVAGLALLRDGVGSDRLGEGLGYAGTGRMVGLVAGPPLGGLVDRAGGYYAVCILGFVIVAVDAVMRLAVVEKKEEVESRDQSAVHMQEGVDAARVDESNRKSTATARNTHAQPEPQESEKRVSFAGFKLLKQPRVVITLWALGIDGLIIGACDAVCSCSSESPGVVVLELTIPPHRRCLLMRKDCSDGMPLQLVYSSSPWQRRHY